MKEKVKSLLLTVCLVAVLAGCRKDKDAYQYLNSSDYFFFYGQIGDSALIKDCFHQMFPQYQNCDFEAATDSASGRTMFQFRLFNKTLQNEDKEVIWVNNIKGKP